MKDYTKESRLHMAYSFEMLGNNFSPSFIRDTFEDFFKMGMIVGPVGAFQIMM